MAGLIEIRGIDALQKKLKNLEQLQRALTPPMREAVDMIHHDVQDQPPKAPGAFSQLATPGQRRAYWAKVRENPAIHGPDGYRRSGTLKRGWTKSVNFAPGGIVGRVSNSVGYGPFVHGDAQQPFHKVSGFKKEQKFIEARRREIERAFKKVIDRELAK